MALTSNGAVTLASSGDPLVDLYFQTSRGLPELSLHTYMKRVWETPRETPVTSKDEKDPVYTQPPLAKARTLLLRSVFQLRDIRNKGKGERLLFHQALAWLTLNDLPTVIRLLKEGHVAMFGSTRDLALLARMPFPAPADVQVEVKAEEAKTGVKAEAKIKVVPHPNVIAVRRAAVHAMVKLLHKDFTILREEQDGKGETKRVAAISLQAKWVPRRKSKRDIDGLYSQIAAAFGSYNQRQAAPLLDSNTKEALGGSQETFRKQILVPLTRRLRVVEQLMAAGKWDAINFNYVPSQASLRYRAAFRKHRPETKGDVKSYDDWVKEAKETAEKLKAGEKVERGAAKIHTEAVYAHQILAAYTLAQGTHVHDTKEEYKEKFDCHCDRCHTERKQPLYDWTTHPRYDATVEAAWVQLVARMKTSLKGKTALVMADFSGSMQNGVGVVPMHIALTMGCLFSELTAPPFQGRWLNFSTTPTFQTMELTKGGVPTTLLERISRINDYKSNWGGSTNLQAALDLVLTEAVQHRDAGSTVVLPDVLCVVSDMEFNKADENVNTNFAAMQRRFEQNKFVMPQVVFWNVYSLASTLGSPVSFDQKGVALVSGFSAEVMEQVMACDPKKLIPINLVESVLCEPVYRPIVWRGLLPKAQRVKTLEALPLPVEP
ncbi:Domain of unknown function (DUF2828)-containing protein [uncultured virus]|nr:Domain of unknown function (DUF2828)-containing protein [uncultured virus]